jgi:transcription elongation factor GreA
MTDQLRKKLQEEVDALEHELVHELPKEIKRAAALGDLSENAEYHMAKQRQEFVKARFRQLGKRLADLSLTNMNNIPKDKVGLGSTVKVYDSTKNEEIEYKLVTSEESDVGAGKISTTSPIGRALLNKKVGEEATVITPNGKRELEILSLSTVHDEAGSREGGSLNVNVVDERLRPGLRSVARYHRSLAGAVAHQSQCAHVHGTVSEYLGRNPVRLGHRRDAAALFFSPAW